MPWPWLIGRADATTAGQAGSRVALPTLQAKSFYGQPVKKHKDLKAFMKELEQERRQSKHGTDRPAAELTQAERGNSSMGCQLPALKQCTSPRSDR